MLCASLAIGPQTRRGDWRAAAAPAPLRHHGIHQLPLWEGNQGSKGQRGRHVRFGSATGKAGVKAADRWRAAHAFPRAPGTLNGATFATPSQLWPLERSAWKHPATAPTSGMTCNAQSDLGKAMHMSAYPCAWHSSVIMPTGCSTTPESILAEQRLRAKGGRRRLGQGTKMEGPESGRDRGVPRASRAARRGFVCTAVRALMPVCLPVPARGNAVCICLLVHMPVCPLKTLHKTVWTPRQAAPAGKLTGTRPSCSRRACPALRRSPHPESSRPPPPPARAWRPRGR